MSYKSELIRKLFSDRLKKDELKDLSEIDMIERKMKVQWEEQNPIAENSERVDPELGDYIWAKIVKEYKVRSKRKSIGSSLCGFSRSFGRLAFLCEY